MKKALITGINGQDGSYLAELLLEKGYEVFGGIRRNSVQAHETSRINHILNDLSIEYVDVGDSISVDNLIRSVQPDEVYHLASMSHVGISFTQPIYTLESVLVSTVNILHAIKNLAPQAKFYQACSSEIFGNASSTDFQNEHSPKNPVSPYGIAKLATYHFVRQYRNSFNIFAANGILFNHESPRRGEAFVTQKIVLGAHNIANNLTDKLELGNLKSKRDWGHAKDYTKAMWLILQHDVPDDFVCATGKVHSIEDVCSYVFEKYGLDYKDHVTTSNKFLRPEDLTYLRGDSTKAKETLGWKANYSFHDLLDEMIDHVNQFKKF